MKGTWNNVRKAEKKKPGRSSNVRKRKKKQNKLGMLGTLVAVVLILLVLTIQTQSLKSKNDELLAKQQLLLSQLDKEEQRSVEIEQEAAYMQTKQYVEEVAKDKLGLVYEGEILFKPAK